MNFKNLFTNSSETRNNFLARVFGVFSEEIVKFWLANENCPYLSCGRPTIFDSNNKKVALLDFTIRSKNDNKLFIVEQKNLIAFKKGTLRFMSNDEAFNKNFLKWSRDKAKQTVAWNLFLNPLTEYQVKVKGEEIVNFGKILIWPSFDENKKNSMISQLAIDEILSLEIIHAQLITWKDPKYQDWINARIRWTEELFDQLTS